MLLFLRRCNFRRAYQNRAAPSPLRYPDGVPPRLDRGNLSSCVVQEITFRKAGRSDLPPFASTGVNALGIMFLNGLGCRFAQESFDLVVQIFRNPERITVSVRS